MLYDKFVLGINGEKTPTPQIGSPFIVTLLSPINFFIKERIPVATKNQKIYTNDLPTDAENTDNINTPTITIIGA